MSDPLGTAASLVEVGSLLFRVVGKLRSRSALDAFETEIGAAVDEALAFAVAESGLPPDGQEAMFGVLRGIVLRLGADQLSHLVEGSADPDEFDEIGDIDPNLKSVMVDFGTKLRAALLTRAQRANSPLFGHMVLLMLSAVRSDIRDLYNAPGASDELVLERLPPLVATRIREIAASDRRAASQLARWLGNPSDRERGLIDLVGRPPEWLRNAGVAAWLVIAELAAAHGYDPPAHEGFRRAAEDEGDPRRRLVWRARAAQYGPSPVEDLEVLRGELTDATEQAFIEALLAAQRQDHDALRGTVDAGLGLNDAADFILLSFKAQALRMAGRVDEAIELMRFVLTADHTGIALMLANALTLRAVEDRAPNRVGDAAEALRLASEAIVVRRAWGGDSAAAVAAACEAAGALDDWEAVVRLGSHTHGDATAEEAANPTVVDLVGAGLVLTGTPSDSRPGGTASGSAWIRGMLAGRDPDRREEARAAFLEAVEHADGELELERSLRGLAVLGEQPLPRLGELAADKPDVARGLDAYARFRATGDEGAVAELRQLAAGSRMATGFLIDIESDRGNAAISADLAVDAARRFNDPTFYVMAVSTLIGSDPDKADEIAVAALDVLPPAAPARRELREARLIMARRSNDPRRVLVTAQQAIAEGLNDRRLPWMIVEAHLADNAAGQAWAQIKAQALEPEDEIEAQIFLHAHALAAPPGSTRALDVLDRFSTSHDVLGAGISLVFGAERDMDGVPPSIVEDIQRRYGMHLQRFVETFPDSPAIRSVSVDTESPEATVASIEAQLPVYDPEIDGAANTLYEHLDNGDLPIGALGALFRRSAIDIICDGAMASVPWVPSERRIDPEVAAARSALNQDVIVDSSTLAALSLTPGAWPLVVAASGRLSIVSSQRQEIVTFARRTVGSAYTVNTAEGIRFHEIAQVDRDAIAARSAWMSGRSAELHQDIPVLSSPIGPLGDLETRGSWAHALHLAHHTNRPLLCDDVGLADMARSLGVVAFGSYAFLFAAAQAELVPVEAVAEHLRDCFVHDVVDLPVVPQVLLKVAQDEGWPSGPLLRVISRPSWWRNADALGAFRMVVTEVVAQDREMIGAVAAAAIRGAARAVPPQAASGFVMPLMIQVLVSAEARPSEFTGFVAAMRAAWRWDGDPLESLTKALLEDLQDVDEAAVLGEFVMRLAEELPEADRALVARTILSAGSS